MADNRTAKAALRTQSLTVGAPAVAVVDVVVGLANGKVFEALGVAKGPDDRLAGLVGTETMSTDDAAACTVPDWKVCTLDPIAADCPFEASNTVVPEMVAA